MQDTKMSQSEQPIESVAREEGKEREKNAPSENTHRADDEPHADEHPSAVSALGSGVTSSAVRSGCRCDTTSEKKAMRGGGSTFGTRDIFAEWGDRYSKQIGAAFMVFCLSLAALMMWQTQLRRKGAPPLNYNLLPAKVTFGGTVFPGEYFRGIESTYRVKNSPLIDEIKLVIEAGQAPAFIFGNTVSPEQNVAVFLKKAYENTLPSREESAVYQSLRASLPAENWDFQTALLKAQEPMWNIFSERNENARRLIGHTDAAFEFVMIDGDYGAYPDPDLFLYLRTYADLAEYDIAYQLQSGQLDTALYLLAFTFRLCTLAAHLENEAVRYEVKQVRERALVILQSLLQNPQRTKSHLQYARDILQLTLSSWKSDEGVWIGNRASGMRVYEITRRFGIEEALEPDEIDELKNALGDLKKIKSQLFRTIDKDEVTYLRAMHDIIALCESPYCKRSEVLDEIDAHIATQWEMGNQAMIAHFLLRGIGDAMAAFAHDLALVESAEMALSLALELPVDKTKLNPQYGKPYLITQEKNRISVTNYQQSRGFTVLTTLP